MASVTFTMTPIEGEEPPPCANDCGSPARVMVTPDGLEGSAPCCGAALCQFNVCTALVGQGEE